MAPPPFTRVLLATEHTEFDVGAEAVALELAGRWKLPLLAVLPLVTNPEYEVAAPAHARAAEQAVAARADALHAAAAAAHVELALAIRRGDEPYREIVAEARARGADLVIARRRGRQSFLSRMMVGEMVGNVVREAPCSVLLVPRACRMWSTTVVAAVDATPAAATVVAHAAAVAAVDDLPLVIASVAAHDTPAARSETDAAASAAVAVARRGGRVAQAVVAAGPPAERIAAIARESGAGLVVVGRGGSHSALRRMVFGGTARQVAGLVACPVLVVSG